MVSAPFSELTCSSPGTLTSFVYAFGFVQLIPQLIINYVSARAPAALRTPLVLARTSLTWPRASQKLKSVAHLPMKTFVYKALGTVVDDVASFAIMMPWMHRLACFRGKSRRVRLNASPCSLFLGRDGARVDPVKLYRRLAAY